MSTINLTKADSTLPFMNDLLNIGCKIGIAIPGAARILAPDTVVAQDDVKLNDVPETK
jgi:hypothetical protein